MASAEMECDLKMEMIFENSRRSSISSRVATNAAPWLEDPIAPNDEWRHCDAIARHQKGGRFASGALLGTAHVRSTVRQENSS